MDKQTLLNRFLLQNQKMSLINKPHFKSTQTLKQAAVLIPIVQRNNGLNIILTERALHLRHHPGQVSFPGGKYESKDVSLQNTALRETQEEIGLSSKQINIVGRLTTLSTSSGFIVTPYLGFIDKIHSLKIDPQEVKSVFEVPLNFLLNKNNFYLHHLGTNTKRRSTYCIPYQNKMIWGATAQIIKNLQKQLLD